MALVIVTQNQYIVASKILNICMDEQVNYVDVRLPSGKLSTGVERYYQIGVHYISEPMNSHHSNQSSGDYRECSVILRGAKNAHAVFNSIIEQIREQIPDDLFLAKALEKMLGNMDEAVIEAKDTNSTFSIRDSKRKRPSKGKKMHILKEEEKRDSSSKKVRRTRKTKRASKDILRKPKKRR